MGGLLLGGRGKLTSAACRQKVIELIAEANATCAPLNAGGVNLKLLEMVLIAVKAVAAM